MEQLEITDQIEPAPTTGSFYRIAYGDTLFGVAGRAFGTVPGPGRYAAARIINDSTYNRRFLGKPTDLFPEGIVSFMPRFVSDANLQASATPAPAGHSFATLWIPAYAGDEPDLRPRRRIDPGVCDAGLARVASEDSSPSNVLVARASDDGALQLVRVAHGKLGVLYRVATSARYGSPPAKASDDANG